MRGNLAASDIAKLLELPLSRPYQKSHLPMRKISTLFEPVEDHILLKIPIIDWPPDKWRSTSDEAKFSYDLGLKKQLDPNEIFALAADFPELRAAYIKYYITNYNKFTPRQRIEALENARPFLPSITAQGKAISTPSKCFTNQSALSFGFPVLEDELFKEAHKFAISSDPTPEQLVHALLGDPPSLKSAQYQLSYLFSRLPDFRADLLKQLGQANIVPVHPKSTRLGTTEATHLRPIDIFTETKLTTPLPVEDLELYHLIFNFVDFGLNGNLFLQSCGSRAQPTVLQIAEILIDNPAQIFCACVSHEIYLRMLRRIAAEKLSLQENQKVWMSLQRSPFLLAFTAKPEEFDEFDNSNVGALTMVVSLEVASNILINDDVATYRAFKPKLMIAPEEEQLEAFYESLGAKKTSKITQYQYIYKLPLLKTSDGEKLRLLITERYQIFVHEENSTVKYDAQWLSENLVVFQTDSIQQNRTLKWSGGVLSDSLEISAITELKGERGELYFTPHYTIWDISHSLCRCLLLNQRLNLTTLFHTLLQTDLQTLNQMGYNTARILARNLTENPQYLTTDDTKIKQNTPENTESTDKFTSKSKQLDSPLNEDEFINPNNSTYLAHSNASELPDREGGSFPRHLKSSTQLNRIWKKIFRGPVKAEQVPLLPAPSLTQAAHQNPVSSAHNLRSILESAIRSSRPARQGIIRPMEESEIRPNQNSDSDYCDISKGQNLDYLGTINTYDVYLEKGLDYNILDELRNKIIDFAEILTVLARVFSCNSRVLHIFYDTTGGTIAFNRESSIYCNLRKFDERLESRQSMLVNWWITLCHEFAHNIIMPHGAAHSFYTETFVEQYLSVFLEHVGNEKE